jgi:glycine cleavage system H protein
MADIEIPKDLRYSREDEWMRVEGEQIVIGVTDYAQSQLGDIVFLELPEVGATLTKGEAFGTIESVKAVSDLFAPVSGEVLAINENLEGQPELVNDAPYAEGWLIEIFPSDESELEGLLDADGYAAHCEDRE